MRTRAPPALPCPRTPVRVLTGCPARAEGPHCSIVLVARRATVVPDIQLHRRLGLVPHRDPRLACCEGTKRSELAQASKQASKQAGALAPFRRRRPQPVSATVLTPLLLLSPRSSYNRLLATSPCSSSPRSGGLGDSGKGNRIQRQLWSVWKLNFGFLAGVSGSRISAAAPILEPGSCHAESPIGTVFFLGAKVNE